MDVLLSVKPKFVEKIISGTKRYEFRKIIFKENEINRIYIYIFIIPRETDYRIV
jgi:predicted transcriptional regulator